MADKKLTRYTSSQRAKMVRQFAKMLDTIKPVIVEKFGSSEAIPFQKKALSEFRENILPALPFIGGRNNPYTMYLVQTAMALALYRTVQQWGGNLEKAGELVYKGMQIVVSKYPRFIMRLYGRWVHSGMQYARMRRDALASHKHVFDGDWVYDFVDGSGQAFSYGIDMYECGIMKFLTAQSAPELVPYLCAVDYITSYALGVELQRDETLAVGCSRCNFRFFVTGKPMRPGWPPVFPEKKNQRLKSY